MKTSLKVALAVAGAGAIVAWIVIEGEQRHARLTAKGTAVVTAVTLAPDSESSSLDETEFDLGVQAGDKVVAASATLPGNRVDDFHPGHTFTVCYDPANPADVDIELTAQVACGA